MPTIRASCPRCSKEFTEHLTESRGNYDEAEKKARMRTGSHTWSKHPAEFGGRPPSDWDDLLKSLTVQCDWEEGSGEGQGSRREDLPPAVLGGPEPGVALVQRNFPSQALQDQGGAMAVSTLPEPGPEPASVEGFGLGVPGRSPGVPPMRPPAEDSAGARRLDGPPRELPPVAGVMPPPPPVGGEMAHRDLQVDHQEVRRRPEAGAGEAEPSRPSAPRARGEADEPLCVGEWVEVFSHSQQAWRWGRVREVDSARVHVVFQRLGAGPDESVLKKLLLGSTDLRRASFAPGEGPEVPLGAWGFAPRPFEPGSGSAAPPPRREPPPPAQREPLLRQPQQQGEPARLRSRSQESLRLLPGREESSLEPDDFSRSPCTSRRERSRGRPCRGRRAATAPIALRRDTGGRRGGRACLPVPTPQVDGASRRRSPRPVSLETEIGVLRHSRAANVSLLLPPFLRSLSTRQLRSTVVLVMEEWSRREAR